MVGREKGDQMKRTMVALLLIVASLPIVGGAGGASALSFKGGCAIGPGAKFARDTKGPTVVEKFCTFKVPGTGNLVDRSLPISFLVYGSGSAANVNGLKVAPANGDLFVWVARLDGRTVAQCHKKFVGTGVCVEAEKSETPIAGGATLQCILQVGAVGNLAATAGGGCLF